MKQWYISRNSQNIGPMPESELRLKQQSGELLQTDYVWCEGLPDWVPVPRIATVLPPLPQAPAPAPRPLPPVPQQQPAPAPQQWHEQRPVYPQQAQAFYQPEPRPQPQPELRPHPQQFADQQPTYRQAQPVTDQAREWQRLPSPTPAPASAGDFPIARGAPGTRDPAQGTIQLIYILYLIGAIIPIVGLIAMIIAIVHKGKDTSPVADSHYEWQIRSYWMYWVYAIAGIVLALLIVGYLVLLAAWVLWIVRSIMGLQSLGRNEGMPVRPLGDIKAWLWG